MCLNWSLAPTQQSLSSHWLLQGILWCRTMTSCCCSQHAKAGRGGRGKGGKSTLKRSAGWEYKESRRLCISKLVPFCAFAPFWGCFVPVKQDLFICSEDNLSCASGVSLCAMQKLQVRPAVWCLSSGKEIWTAPAHKFDRSKVLPLWWSVKGFSKTIECCKRFLKLEWSCLLGFTAYIV